MRVGYTYEGCYILAQNTQFYRVLRNMRSMSPTKCNFYCESHGFHFFALKNGVECLCGQDIETATESNEENCNLPCVREGGVGEEALDPGERIVRSSDETTCGGIRHANIYSTFQQPFCYRYVFIFPLSLSLSPPYLQVLRSLLNIN